METVTRRIELDITPEALWAAITDRETLEAWLGHTRARGARRIWAIGAYGSNHAIATVVHARRIGLDAGAILFPQPGSEWAAENAGALIEAGVPLVRLRNVVEVPFAGALVARREPDAVVMPPGGATPIGTLGALSAALEVAEQVAEVVVGHRGSSPSRSASSGNDSRSRRSAAWAWLLTVPVPTPSASAVSRSDRSS